MIQVKLDNISFGYDPTRQVLGPLNLALAGGEFVSLLGPSGCGKSTLLRLVTGLLEPTSGRVERTMGPLSIVFQDARLLPWKNVRENVLLPFAVSGLAAPDTEDVLRQVGMWEARDLFPHQLSGGMKQRVAIARALISRPQLLAMDEPFSALDEGTRVELEQLLRDLWVQLGMTLLFVTHSLSEAVFLSERVIVMGAGGKVLHDRNLKLPARTPLLRTSTEFNEQVRDLTSLVVKARESVR